MVTGIDPSTGQMMTNNNHHHHAQQTQIASQVQQLTQLGNIANGSPTPPQSGASSPPEPVKRASDTRRVSIFYFYL